MDVASAANRFLPDAVVSEQFVSGENAVYRIRAGKREAILRLSPEHHRTARDLDAELAFVRYLAGHGFPAAAPIPTPQGEFVIPVAAGHAAAFEVAPGKPAEAFGPEWDSKLFHAWGRSIGMLHNLSEGYPHAADRFAWHEEQTVRWMPANLTGVAREAYNRLVPIMEAGTETATILVHGDFGRSNFHVDRDLITVFDFDDCMRHVAEYDICVALWPLRNRDLDERRGYLDWMLTGYRLEHSVDADRLQALFDWRTLYMFGHHLRKWGSRRTDQQDKWLSSLEAQLVDPPCWSP